MIPMIATTAQTPGTVQPDVKPTLNAQDFAAFMTETLKEEPAIVTEGFTPEGDADPAQIGEETLTEADANSAEAPVDVAPQQAETEAELVEFSVAENDVEPATRKGIVPEDPIEQNVVEVIARADPIERKIEPGLRDIEPRRTIAGGQTIERPEAARHLPEAIFQKAAMPSAGNVNTAKIATPQGGDAVSKSAIIEPASDDFANVKTRNSMDVDAPVNSGAVVQKIVPRPQMPELARHLNWRETQSPLVEKIDIQTQVIKEVSHGYDRILSPPQPQMVPMLGQVENAPATAPAELNLAKLMTLPDMPMSIPADLRLTSSPQVFETAAPTGQQVKLAQQVSQQMTVAMSKLDNGTTTLLLYPKELGRVQMTVHMSDAGPTLHIVSERSETYALMRQNAEQISADFRALGQGSVTFSFQSKSDGESGSDHPGSAPSFSAEETEDDAVILALTETGHVDIRL